MRLESNVGMVKGNKVAHNYASHLKFKKSFKNMFLESRNIKGVKWVDILNMYSKNDLINWYNENIVKTKTINNKTIYKKKDKTKYFEELPKYFNETTKDNIIKWLLQADQFPFHTTYKINQSISNQNQKQINLY